MAGNLSGAADAKKKRELENKMKKYKSVAAFALPVATSSEEYYQETPKTEEMVFCFRIIGVYRYFCNVYLN